MNYSKIHKICKEYGITDYTINGDGSIDVDGNVDLPWIELTKLPLKFNNVSGAFLCNGNKLTTLEGCPKSVGGNFNCSFNKLTTLEGSPQSIGGNFYCSRNKLTTLKGGSKSVGGSFDCSGNQLTTLEGCPKSVGGGFYCDNNPIYDQLGNIDYKSYIKQINRDKILNELLNRRDT